MFINKEESTVTLSEVPKEISYTFVAKGCPNNCIGCHSTHNKKIDIFTDILNLKDYQLILEKYKDKVSCITWLGGEWNDGLIFYLYLAKEYGYKTCLYTGLDTFNNSEILKNLDYIKIGSFKKELGGLDKESTNQRFYSLKNGTICEDLTYLFRRK